ncbi:MAG: FKBP-type peptidyl-prolyl cis-trans isomerase [Tannerella sp.]|jgi:FKBP-type peptidyl-prolyl cis-trans isomerase SlyD|nr:FKBP-type peptidyl-prolyl cis-trans isomerase [Tannerella sp.]
MIITKNKFVAVEYDLHVGDEGEDRILMESATRERPLQFIYGSGSMIEAFEEQIAKLEQGAKFEFSLKPENAYGEYVEDHVVELPRKIFEVEGKFDAEYVKEGATLPMRSAEGGMFNGSVLEVRDDVVVMDFNHPLAGETLHFKGEVLDVHNPTEEEIDAINKSLGGGCGCGCGCEEDCESEDCECGCDGKQ